MPREYALFKMTSRKEQLKQQKQYTEKMFPLGEALQKDKEFELLSSVLQKDKLSKIDVLFNLLCAKQALMQEDPDDLFNDLSWWFTGNNAKDFDIMDRVYFISAASLLIKIKSIDEFPCKEDVITKSKSVLIDYSELINK